MGTTKSLFHGIDRNEFDKYYITPASRGGLLRGIERISLEAIDRLKLWSTEYIGAVISDRKGAKIGMLDDITINTENGNVTGIIFKPTAKPSPDPVDSAIDPLYYLDGDVWLRLPGR